MAGRSSRSNKEYNIQLIDTLYNHLPAFTDIFDEDTWYTFVAWFVTGTIVLAFILSKYITIKPVE